MMDHPPVEKTESHDTIKNDETENLDESPIPKTETQASEKADESKEVLSDNEKTLNDQEIDLQSNEKEKKYSTELMITQDFPTEDKTEKNQDSDTENTETEKLQVVETKITEQEEEEKETGIIEKLILIKKYNEYDSNESKAEAMEDKEKVSETICTADSTTDANTIIIDLCDDDQIEIYEQTDSENILAGNTNFKSYSECDASNKATPGNIEDSIEKEGENETTAGSNKQTIDPVIIDLCGDDPTETDEQNDCSTQGHTAIPSTIGTEPNESKIEPIRIIDSIISDDSKTEMEPRAIEKAESETFELTDEDKPKEACELIYEGKHKESGESTDEDKPKEDREVTDECNLKEDDEFIDETKPKQVCDLTYVGKPKEADELIDEDEPKEAGESFEKDKSNEADELTDEDKPKEACLSTGKDLSEAPCKSLSVCHTDGTDPNYSKTTKDVNLTGGYNEEDRTVPVNIEEACEASMTKDNPDETEIKTKNEDYEIENFRFKDDIITLQEDYGMDTKQSSHESSENIEKSNMVSENANFNILDECVSEEKRCETNKLKLGCGREGMTETKTSITEIAQSVSNLEEPETTSNLRTEETESGENNIHEPDPKAGVNEQEDIKLILIKQEIEDNLKNFGCMEKKENIASEIEEGENSLLQCEETKEQGQENIHIPSTSDSSKVSTKDMEGDVFSENRNQLAETAGIKLEPEKNEKSTGTNNGGIVESYSKNLQLIINLDIVESGNNLKQSSFDGCATKGSNSKVCQTENADYANKSLASAYLNDTPPSLSESDSNEEFFDAVEYIPEGTATKETSLTIKPSTSFLTRVHLINEPIPGPSGISTKKKKDEMTVLQPIEEKEEDFKEATEFSSDEESELAEEEKGISNEKCSQTGDTLKKKESRKHDDLEDDDENRNQKKIKLD